MTNRLLALLFCALTLPAAAQITVQQPVSGTTVSSPMRVVASNPNATHIKVYVDNLERYATNNKSFDTSIDTSNGTHYVVVQSWDAYGNVDKYPLTVTTSGTSYSHVLANLEEAATWGTCGSCGNHVGDSRYVWGTQQFVLSPALNGKASKFSVGGDNPYTNYYWFLKTYTGVPYFTRAKMSFDYLIPAGSDPQAVEFEGQYRYNNWQYNFAIQIGYKSLRYRTFDYQANKWQDLGAAVTPLANGAWHHVEAEWAFDHAAHTRRLVALTVDGQRIAITAYVTLPAFYNANANYMTYAAFQLDMNSYAQDYSAYVDNYTFQYE